VDAVLSAALVIGFFAVLAFVVFRARAAREYADFSLAKRSLPLALIFASLCATYIGPGFSIGFVGKGFQSGLLFLCIGLAYSAQNILVGFLIAPRLRSLTDCHTLGDAMGLKYNRASQVLAGVISVGLCAGFAAVMANAAGVVVEQVFGIALWKAVIAIAVLATTYTSLGGLKTSVMIDALQFAVFSILMAAMFFFLLVRGAGNDATAFSGELAAATSAGFRSVSAVQIVGLVAAFLLGETLIPPYANRALAAQSTSASRNSFLLAGTFSFLWFTMMISLGTVARTVVPPETDGDHVLLRLVQTTMPTTGRMLLLIALISVIMSSLDSLLNAGAVVFTQDVVKPLVAISDRASLACGRVATVAMAALAAAAAVAVPEIITGLLICYTIWAPAILPAAVFGLWLKRPRPWAGILSMVTGATVALSLQFAWPNATEIPPILLALGASLAAYLLGHLLGGRVAGAACPWIRRHGPDARASKEGEPWKR
jgi:SSS family solute:Na+ symporter